MPWDDQTPERLKLTVSDDSWLAPTAWSPDGQRVPGAIVASSGSTLYSAIVRSQSDIWMIELAR